jgi:hypothetical protein
MQNARMKKLINLLAREAKIGEAIKSPTINADDKTPS